MKYVVISVIILALMTGAVAADSGAPAPPETQGLTTGTSIQALGTVTETDALIAATVPSELPLDEEIAYSTSYHENTIADQGMVTYVKSFGLDTAAQTIDMNNIQATKVVEFAGFDTGRMISSEGLVLDGAGSWLSEAEKGFICPFMAPVGSYSPAFCNIAEMGSAVDVTIGSLATETGEHVVSYTGDPGVSMDYSIKLTGFGDVPAMGSAEAYINTHIQEGRQVVVVGEQSLESPKAEDLVYRETTTASGDISLFQKAMHYNSKFTGVLPYVTVS